MIEHAAVNDHPLVSVPSWSASWRIGDGGFGGVGWRHDEWRHARGSGHVEVVEE